MVDRREHERVLHQLRLTLSGAEGQFGGHSVDLSEGGLLLVCGRELSLGTRWQLRLHLRRGSLTLPIRVLRQTVAGPSPAYGVCFIEPSPHALAALRATVAEAAMRHALGPVTDAPRPRVQSHVRLRIENAPPISTDGRDVASDDESETVG